MWDARSLDVQEIGSMKTNILLTDANLGVNRVKLPSHASDDFRSPTAYPRAMHVSPSRSQSSFPLQPPGRLLEAAGHASILEV